MEPLPSLESVLARLASSGVSIPSGRVRLDGYGDSSALSEELLALIRAGAKRAGTSLLWACEADGEPIPHAGDIEVVLDHRGEPAIITRITAVSIVPFNEVTGSYAAVEGEGDGSLEFWRRAHWNFFSRECRRIGREPAETMPVVCNTFEVMQVLPHSD